MPPKPKPQASEKGVRFDTSTLVTQAESNSQHESQGGGIQKQLQVKKPPPLIYNSMKRKTYSKYDLVKVKVSLEEHFYVFSRFLISRVLTFIKVKEKDAIKMTLEVKKILVENNTLEINQKDLEKMLFQILQKFGYDDRYVNRYNIITSFYQKRVPYIIMIAGTECMGKSTLVTQLGERINMSNIVSTSIVQKVMNGLSQINIKPQNLSNKQIQDQADDEIIQDYRKMCRYVRKGINFDIQKCFVDGKPLILEGSHIDPDFYLKNEINEDGTQKLLICTPDPENEEESALENASIKKMRKTMQEIDQKGSMIIPFLLTISPQSHALCLESKIQQEFSLRSQDIPKDIKSHVSNLIRKYQVIQDYLKKESIRHGFTQLEININSFDETIETIHDIILKSIEDGYAKGIF